MTGDLIERREWLIRKSGYFYRPNRAGYTSVKAEAGRYTEVEARREAAIEPDNMTALHQDEVPSPVNYDTETIASLRTALATERDRAERAEKRADANADHARLANANLKLASDASAANLARAEAAEASLAEATRLLRPFGVDNDLPTNLPDDTRLIITFAGQIVAHAKFGDFRDAARFLAQESNDG